MVFGLFRRFSKLVSFERKVMLLSMAKSDTVYLIKLELLQLKVSKVKLKMFRLLGFKPTA